MLSSPSDIAEAGEVIRVLLDQGVMTTLASSKTFSEMIRFYEKTSLAPSPFIFENGCGIGWPLDELPSSLEEKVVLRRGGFGALLLGSGLISATETLLERREKDGLDFSLMSELLPRELTILTGLDLEAAEQALERMASIPILWRGSADAFMDLQEELSGKGLTVVSGGTFRHVSPPCDKYSALLKIFEWQNERRDQFKLLACGDSENDVSLLKHADVALLFSAEPDSPLIPLIEGPVNAMNATSEQPAGLSVRVIQAAGPSNWIHAVTNELKSRKGGLTA